MKILVTCGPSSEPIDQVRRITNFSTGSLGIELSNALTEAGFDVTCMIGEGRTCFTPLKTPHVQTFFSTSDLLKLLQECNQKVDVVFHASALSDFTVDQVLDDDRHELNQAKVSSQHQHLWIKLKRAPKVIQSMRSLFPSAKIVGWKYELEGNELEALSKAREQMQSCSTDACVLNGKAVGQNFLWCTPEAEPQKLASKAELIKFLVAWSKNQAVT